ncbi:unnamed protein product [Didymodactylos carnosus]|nr:unnamed protein product [Didymodactylos carnosus]CAF3662393.1 unnamed protein product [Didymodactylos carnosus]
MSTKNSSQQHPVSDRERVNLESHQLIWLDKSINSNQSDSTVTVERLRNVVDYTKLYYNPEECLQHIEQTKDTATFLIGSDELVRIFIPKIHDLENIQAIYIYCSQNEYCQQWISNYSKVSPFQGFSSPTLSAFF